MLESWQDQITDSFLSMVAKATPSVRAEIIRRVEAAFMPQSPLDPGASPDTLPINQKNTVSVVRREFGRVTLTEREQAEQEATHPHERKDPEMYAEPRRKRLPLGEPL